MKTAGFIRQEAKKSILKRLPWLLLIPIGLLLPRMLALNPALVERIYSGGIYPVVNSMLRNLFGIIPYSVAEWLAYALVLAVPLVLLARIVRALLGRISFLRVLHLCITYLILLGLALNSFYILWGINYFRPPLSALLELDVRSRPEEELTELCHTLSKTAAALREELPEDAAGVYTLGGQVGLHMGAIPDAYEKLGAQIPLFKMQATKPKRVVNSEAMSWAGIAGIYIPFTAEPNVNMHQSELLLLSAAAHESAHGLGIAREDEANFISYLACLQADSPLMQYSGVMLALIHSGNQLNAVNHEEYIALYESYSEAMRRDLRAHSAYWQLYEGPMEEAVERVNDNYLKYNQQESGVQSYGEMVDLLLAWQAAGKLQADA